MWRDSSKTSADILKNASRGDNKRAGLTFFLNIFSATKVVYCRNNVACAGGNTASATRIVS